MKPSKLMVFVGVAVASACVLAGLVTLRRHTILTLAQPPAPAPVPSAAPEPSAPEARAVPSDTAVVPPAKADLAGSVKAAPPVQPKPVPASPAPGSGSSVQDPLAREALSLVGLDPKAEAYWVGAINDSRLSAPERQNLIEDLNEDGLSDPKHPAPEDLPLILNRLALIEELAPSAMDDANRDAFMEAYKDLVNLADLVMGGGKPVN